MNHRPPAVLVVLLAGIVWLGFASPAAALSCDASVTDVAFGSVDTLAGAAVDTTATVDISCTSIGILGVRVCPYLGDGSGGRDGSARYMQGPSGPLAYQLYTDASRTTVWGSATLGFGSFPTVDFSGNLLATATGNTSLTLYGRVFAGQGSAPPDSYLSSFTAVETEFRYGINVLDLVACDGIQLLTSTTNPTFNVTATVPKNCLIGTSDVNFGSHGALVSDVTAIGAVSVQCTADTAFSVALGNGLTGSGPATRLMTKGLETVTYGLYQDAGHVMPWGTTGADLVTGTGDAGTAVLDVYGLVPAQTTPSPGLYQDTVVATVVY